MKLKAFQEEMKNVIFIHEKEAKTSPLWNGPVPARMDVYRSNTRLNWTDTLDHDFPLTANQFTAEAWADLRQRYFICHPPAHWELNASMTPFARFLKGQKVKPWIKELADYEWNDLKVFIDTAVLRAGTGTTNPTVVVRAYQHQIFFWVEGGAPKEKPPEQKPEVLIFYRDQKNTCHIREADPLMILLLDHFKRPGAVLADLEPVRRKLLPNNRIALDSVWKKLRDDDLIL